MEEALTRIRENKRHRNPTLDLGDCGLTRLPEEIFELEWLVELVLKWNQLNNPAELEKLARFRKLKVLNLRWNQINDIAPLQGLKVLNKLYLGSNEISDLSPLQGLKEISKLYLEDNQISDLSPLEYLTRITELNLGKNKINDLLPLKYLTHLSEINLSRNPIRDITALRSLTRITKLYLEDNQISDLGPLVSLTRLTDLDLRFNKISDIGPLQHLTQLTVLHLGFNRISDLSPLRSLTKLSQLYLGANRVSNIDPLRNLTRLTELYLEENLIHSLAPLQNLVQLTELYLRSNKISDLSPLRTLAGLAKLMASENRISDPLPLQTLTHLVKLDLSRNAITNKQHVKDLTVLLGLKELNLTGNRIEGIPEELYAKRESTLSNLRDYFNDADKSNMVPENEIKMVLIGNGRVGKTCLHKKLIEDAFDPKESSTHAIKLVEWPLSLHVPSDASSAVGLERLMVNIWDFGGQYIYQATHRLFMQTEALFVLVWDAENETAPYAEEITPSGETIRYPNYPFFYWLSYVQALSRNSPVIVVQTKIESQGHEVRRPRESEKLEKKYPVIFSFEHVDCATGAGTAKFAATVQEAALSILLRTNDELPLNWFAVRTALRKLARSKRQISLEAFRQLCLEHQMEGTSSETVLDFLHHKGVLFYHPGLSGEQIILDQKWAIHAVYSLFDRENIFYQVKEGRDGKFKLADLQEAWKNYSLEEKQLFINFMIGCEICYEVTDKHNLKLAPQQRVYLAPALLPEQRPHAVDRFWRGTEGLYLMYHHEFLHFGIMQSFIVRMGNLEELKLDAIWKNGIWITLDDVDDDKDADALIEAIPDEKKIIVRTKNRGQKGLLEKIRNEFKLIQRHEDTVQEWVSANGKDFVELADLIRKRQKKHTKIVTNAGNECDVADFSLFMQLDEAAQFENTGDEARTLGEDTAKPLIRIFISYARAYTEAFRVFKRNFVTLINPIDAYRIEIFTDEESLQPGDKWHGKLLKNVLSCDIAILLVSDAFFASDYIKKYELSKFLERSQKDNITLVPVQFHPSDPDSWGKLKEIQFFKPLGSKYGLPDKKDDLCFSDLLQQANGNVVGTPNLTRYMIDFVKTLKPIFERIGKAGR
ncbi:MAG: leucine-rich repeat domain-containing protein [Cytophagales bacterium]|nr:leucine-rich repeat domain-containing protein [Cytophagales bacterium]